MVHARNAASHADPCQWAHSPTACPCQLSLLNLLHTPPGTRGGVLVGNPPKTTSEQKEQNNSMEPSNNTGLGSTNFLHNFSSHFDRKLAVLILGICFLIYFVAISSKPTVLGLLMRQTLPQLKYITATITSLDQWMSAEKTNFLLTGLG